MKRRQLDLQWREPRGKTRGDIINYTYFEGLNMILDSLKDVDKRKSLSFEPCYRLAYNLILDGYGAQVYELGCDHLKDAAFLWQDDTKRGLNEYLKYSQFVCDILLFLNSCKLVRTPMRDRALDIWTVRAATRVKSTRAWKTLRRLVPVFAHVAACLRELFVEVTCRPGGREFTNAQSSFYAAAAAATAASRPSHSIFPDYPQDTESKRQPKKMMGCPRPRLVIKKRSPKATAPRRATSGSAGYDLYSSATLSIAPGKRLLVPTDISISVPVGTYGRIAPRSGLAVKHGINVLAGVIDSDYRGHVQAVLVNHSDETFEVKAGDRIAQLILEQCLTPDVEEVDTLDETERGEGGFGSTGGTSKSPQAAAVDDPDGSISMA